MEQPIPVTTEELLLAPKVGDEMVDTENYCRGKRTVKLPENLNLSTFLDEDNLILNHLTVNKGLAKHGKLAEESIQKQFIQMLNTKKAIAPVLKKHISKDLLCNHVKAAVFLKEKVDGNDIFKKLKGRVVADGSMQNKHVYSNLKSLTAKLDSIFILLSMASKKRMFWSKVDIGGAYLNAFFDNGDTIFIILSKQITTILVKFHPKLKQYVDPNTGTMLVQILKAL